MSKTQLQLRVDEETKKKAFEVYQQLGLTLSDAVNLFLKKSITVGGFPFDVRKSPFELRMEQATADYEAFLSSPESFESYDTAHDMIKEELDEV